MFSGQRKRGSSRATNFGFRSRISEEEVSDTLRNIKNGKAMGQDIIPVKI